MKHRQHGASLISTLGWLLIMAGLIWAIFNWAWVYDSWRLIGYQPSSEVAAMAQDTTMTKKGQRLFYATHPEISRGDGFRQHCIDHETGGSILGCYHQQRIYIYDVDSPELTGIKPVTAAHEMLHAGYSRLSYSQRQSVNQLLLQQKKAMQDDTAFQERMLVYDKLSQDETLDELHSILATEIAQLNPELEDYYGRYFTDRGQVIKLYNQYSGVFGQLEAEAQSLKQSLDSRAVLVNQQAAEYETASEQLSGRVSQFNQRASQTGGYTSRSELDSDRQQLIDETDRLEAQRKSINQMIADYQIDKRRYDEIGIHITKLNNSINSSLEAPAEVE